MSAGTTLPVPERLRILIVNNRYRSRNPSGENQVVEDEVNLLTKHGHHEVHRYERDSDEIEGFSRASRFGVPLRVVWSPTDGRNVARMIDRWHPDIVHVHNVFPLISPSVVVSAHRARVPVIATLHNYRLLCAAGTLLRGDAPCQDCVALGPGPALLHGCYRDSRLATAPLAASIALHRSLRTWERAVYKFIVMSQFAREMMMRAGIPQEMIVVKPHSVPEPGVHRADAGSGIVFVGRLTHHKGVDLLIDSWLPEFGRLTVIGDGEERQSLSERATKCGVDIHFAGSMQRNEVSELVASARALVLPSRAYETFGLVAVEAMASGVPVVVPTGGALAEVVIEGVTGVTFESGRVAALRAAIARVIDPAVSRRMGAAARNRYLARFSPEHNLMDLERIYRAAISS